MATYYVDLSLGTNNHAGTELDPFSPADFLLSTASGTKSYLIKGSYTFVNPLEYNVFSSTAQSFDRWLPNEPYRMKFLQSNNIPLRGTWKNGVIYVVGRDNYFTSTSLFYSMFYHGGNKNAIFDGTTNMFDGCIFAAINKMQNYESVDISETFKDTIIDSLGWELLLG